MRVSSVYSSYRDREFGDMALTMIMSAVVSTHGTSVVITTCAPHLILITSGKLRRYKITSVINREQVITGKLNEKQLNNILPNKGSLIIVLLNFCFETSISREKKLKM